MENCPICGNTLKVIETDNRQEWMRTTYSCDECQNILHKHTVYKTQSEFIASETWEHTQRELNEMRDKYDRMSEIRLDNIR